MVIEAIGNCILTQGEVAERFNVSGTISLTSNFYLFANNKDLKNSDIPEITDNDLAFFFNDPSRQSSC